jgi:glyoxylase I family protein
MRRGQRSRAFYQLVFGELGFRPAVDDGDHIIWHNGITSLGLLQATESGAFNRFRVGLHHLALRAARREDVDLFHTFLQDQGIEILDPPAEYPQYGERYYAVFFADPDGMKLELVHFPWGYWRPAMQDGTDPRPRYPRGKPRSD